VTKLGQQRRLVLSEDGKLVDVAATDDPGKSARSLSPGAPLPRPAGSFALIGDLLMPSIGGTSNPLMQRGGM